MSFSCATGSVTASGAAPGPGATVYVQMLGNSYNGSYSPDGVHCNSRWGLTYPPGNEQADEVQDPHGVSGSWNSVVGALIADENYYFQAKARSPAADEGTAYGSVKSRKTQAMIATASTPTSSNVLATTADIACNYVPNVLRSTASAQLQYKKATDGTWINAGTPGALGGYVTRSVTASLTGLEPNTQYQVRLVLTRTTGNNTSLTSATASFTTLAAAPTLTTNPASSVSHNSANLNATVVVPTGGSARVRFEWGEETGPPFSFTTAWQEFLTAGTFQVQQAISGLAPTTTYYYDTKAQWLSPGYENEKWSDA